MFENGNIVIQNAVHNWVRSEKRLASEFGKMASYGVLQDSKKLQTLCRIKLLYYQLTRK